MGRLMRWLRLQKVYIFPPLDRSENIMLSDDDKAFRSWFDTRIGASFARSFSMIPDVEVLSALHALLIRAGFRPEMEPEDDEFALSAYVRLVRSRGAAKASGIAYRIAICATVADLRERHKLGRSTIQIPPAASQKPKD